MLFSLVLSNPFTHAQQRLNGTYTSMHKDPSGDIFGEEILITGSPPYEAVFQVANVAPGYPAIIKVRYEDGIVSFAVPEELYGLAGKFTGEYRSNTLRGRITFSNGQTKEIKLPRAFSYFDQRTADSSRITGTYSSMDFSEEAGDLGGYELKIVSTPRGFTGIFQLAEGSPVFLKVVPISVSGVDVSFTVDESTIPERRFMCAYQGKIIGDSLTLRMRCSEDFGEPIEDTIELQHRKSYWDWELEGPLPEAPTRPSFRKASATFIQH